MAKNVLVIGNGFDLALKLPTRYADFVNSQEDWPFNDYSLIEDAERYEEEIGLELFLTKAVKKQRETNYLDEVKWIDFEALLFEYGKICAHYKQGRDIDTNDEICYKKLIKSFTQYLKKVQTHEIKRNGIAAEVIKAVASNGYFANVYSFNYTDFPTFFRTICNFTQFRPHFIHGSLANDNIVLGITEDAEIPIGYLKMTAKSWNHATLANSLEAELIQAVECVFFGFSFGESDSLYFKKYFEDIIQNYSPAKNIRKRLTIFTYDKDSGLDITSNLFSLGISMQKLKSCMDIEFIHTALLESDKPDIYEQRRFEAFKQRLSRNSREAHDNRLRSIASMMH